MSFRIRRASLAWLAIALVMFALALIITAQVTWVAREPDSSGNSGKEKGRPKQIVSIFQLTPRGAEPYLTSFVANPRGGGDTIDISVFAEDSPVILINNLASPKSCAMIDAAAPLDQKLQKNDQLLTIEAFHSDIRNERVYRLTPRFGSLDQGVHTVRCKIRSTVKYDTFTDRGVELTNYNPFYPRECARPLAPNARDCDRAWLDGLEPRMMPKFIDFNFARMKGVNNLHFSGGYQDQKGEGQEYDRGLANGRRMFVYWEDIYRQQLRDTLLIVIGTLIGIGVTVMIEGIRPYLEALGEKDDRPPQPRREPNQKIEPPSFRPAP